MFDTWRKARNEWKAKIAKRFAEICSPAHKVYVLGMPRDTRVANVLVNADYRMKLVFTNKVSLPIHNPFSTIRDLDNERDRQDLLQDFKGLVNTDQSNRPRTGRLWFHAGRFSYQISPEKDVVFMDCAQVLISDQATVIKNGELVDNPDPSVVNPIHRAFTCAWQARMEEIYKAEPIWRDMHNIFRHFALGRIMNENGALSLLNEMGSTAWLLQTGGWTEAATPTTLPSVSDIDDVEVPYNAFTLRDTSYHCHGGVTANAGYDKPFDKSSRRPATTMDVKDAVHSRR
jgi:hypothetical protein